MPFKNSYYINLPERTDRKEHIERECERVGIYANRIEAVKGDKTATTQSHLIAILAGARIKTNILILEDDCVFGQYFVKEINRTFSQLPEHWDMFYLGANHRIEPEPITTNLARCVKPLTAHSYVINSRSVWKVQQIIIRNMNGKIIDEIYSEAIESGRIVAYCATPNLTWQLPNHSDLEGRFMDYAFMIPEREVNYEQ